MDHNNSQDVPSVRLYLLLFLTLSLFLSLLLEICHNLFLSLSLFCLSVSVPVSDSLLIYVSVPVSLSLFVSISASAPVAEHSHLRFSHWFCFYQICPSQVLSDPLSDFKRPAPAANQRLPQGTAKPTNNEPTQLLSLMSINIRHYCSRKSSTHLTLLAIQYSHCG